MCGKDVNVFVVLICLVALGDKVRLSLVSYLCVLAKLRKATYDLVVYVRPPARNIPASTGRILMKFVIGIFFFRKSVEKIQIQLKSDKKYENFT